MQGSVHVGKRSCQAGNIRTARIAGQFPFDHVIAGILTLVMSASVFAATPGDGSNLERQSQLTTKKAEFEGFRLDLAENSLDVLENRENNISVVQHNTQLRLEMAQTLKALINSGVSLPKKTTAQLKEYTVQITEHADSLKETRVQIKAILEQFKGFSKEKDYAAMDTAFVEITSIQTYRLDVLRLTSTRYPRTTRLMFRCLKQDLALGKIPV